MLRRHRKPCALLLCGAFAAGSAVAATPAWQPDFAAAVADAREREVPVLVALYAEWCGWCRRMDREVYPSAEFHQLAAEFAIVRLDVEDGAEGTALQQRHASFELPTVLLLTPRNSLLGALNGFREAPAFAREVKAALEAARRFETQAAATEAGDDREALRKLALAYHDRADGARARALYDRFLDTFHPEPAEARWIGALIADTLRLDGEFAAAWTRLDALRLEATAAADTAVLRRLEDLAWLLGRDGSECQGVAALARFVREYPESPRRPGAERLLEQRRQQLDMLCA